MCDSERPQQKAHPVLHPAIEKQGEKRETETHSENMILILKYT